MWPWMMGGFWGMGFGMILFWVLIAVVIYLSVTAYFMPRRSRAYGALDIARERYARGEISLEEFERIRENLERH